VRKNKPNEGHAFSLYSLPWFFQGATDRYPWPAQVKIIFLFHIVGLQHEVCCFPNNSIHDSPWRKRKYTPLDVCNHSQKWHSVISQKHSLENCKACGLSDFISVTASSTIISEHYSKAHTQRNISTLFFYDFLM
jgi:hypothetical protein